MIPVAKLQLFQNYCSIVPTFLIILRQKRVGEMRNENLFPYLKNKPKDYAQTLQKNILVIIR